MSTNKNKESHIIKKQQKSKFHNLMVDLAESAISGKESPWFLNKVIKLLINNIEGIDGAIFADKNQNIKLLHLKTNILPKRYSDSLNTAIKNSKDFNLLVAKALKNKKIYIHNNLERSNTGKILKLKEYRLGSFCIIPLTKKNECIGTIILISQYKDFFNEEVYKTLKTLRAIITLSLNTLEERKFHNLILHALDTGFDFVLIADKKLNIVYSNKQIRDFSGYEESELTGKHYTVLHEIEKNLKLKKKFYENIKRREPFLGVLPIRKKDGTVVDFLTTVVPYNANNRTEYYILVSKQLSKETKLINELNHILHYDKVTDLPNYSSFLESLERFIQRAEAQRMMGGITIINPISFKSINEALGFEKGNKLLEAIAERLKKNVFQYDIVAKLESDRFGLILKDLKYEENIVIALTRVFEELEKPYKIDENLIHLSFNIGVSLYPKDGKEAKELINKARAALSAARKKGENQIAFFRKNFELAAKKILNLKSQLHEATKKREFVPYFQPYVNKEKNIVGAESLLRWKKAGSVVPPFEFIPYLEQTDLIRHVELQVLEDVVKILKTLKTPLPISINMSTRSFKNANIFENIMNKIKKHGINPSLVKIEIVERSIIDDFNRMNYLIEKFKSRGVQFAIDDFGTGYSSLSYLSKLKVETLKIDISFVRDLTKSIFAKNIVEFIIFMSKKLNIKTIAEGVETEEQFSILRDMDCDFFQGYLFFKPMPENEFIDVIQQKVYHN